MPRLNVMIERGEVCHSLRSKTMFYEPMVLPEGETDQGEPSGPFWCAQTQSLIGPDGKFADTAACGMGSGRGCCETV